MGRYFLELSYKGAGYSGFQKQTNGNTIQAEVEHAFQLLQRSSVDLTGSSRTDAGVHARQNYFHFDYTEPLHPQFLYKMNAILPAEIVIRSVQSVSQEAHSRFDALARTYTYHVYTRKDPFKKDRAYFFPYKIDENLLAEAAAEIKRFIDFTAFSKHRTQVKNFNCTIALSEWSFEEDSYYYTVSANRFLRGMVRGLTGTMLQIARGKLRVEELHRIIAEKTNSAVDFSVPAHGLFLEKVTYPDNIFAATI
jgi:tRNA pseudouridine38-40 synthase